MECHWYLRNIQEILSDGKTPHKRRFGEPFKGPVIPFGSMVEFHLFLPKTCRDCISSARKSYQEYASVMYYARGESGKETSWSQTLRNWEKMDASEIHGRRLNTKEVLTPKSGENFDLPDRRWNSQIIPRRSGSEEIHRNPEQPRSRRRTRKSFRRIRRVSSTTSRLISQVMVKQEMISGPFQGTTFTVITFLPSLTVRAERRIIPNSTAIHLTWPEQQVRPWMWCFNAA